METGIFFFFLLGDKLGKNFVSIYYLVGSFYPVDFLFLIFVYLWFKSHFLCFRNKDNWIKLEIFFFFREFQLMASAPDDSSLSSDQDTNQFLV